MGGRQRTSIFYTKEKQLTSTSGETKGKSKETEAKGKKTKSSKEKQ